MGKVEKLLIENINDFRKTEVVLHEAEQELMSDPRFKKFLDLQKQVNEKASDVWSYVEEQMLKHDIKQLKGDFGTVTIAERQGWDINEEELPKKFYKKVIDTTKITNTYRLEGKAPKGCTPKTTKYLTKRLK